MTASPIAMPAAAISAKADAMPGTRATGDEGELPRVQTGGSTGVTLRSAGRNKVSTPVPTGGPIGGGTVNELPHHRGGPTKAFAPARVDRDLFGDVPIPPTIDVRL